MADSTFAAEILASPEWRAAVERADGWVRQKLGKYADSKRLDWRLTPDGRQVELRMTDGEFEAADRFELPELRDEWQFRSRASDLWDELINAAMKAEFAGIRAILRELIANEEAAERPVAHAH